MKIADSTRYLSCVEPRSGLWEKPLSLQVEKQLQKDSKRENNRWMDRQSMERTEEEIKMTRVVRREQRIEGWRDRQSDRMRKETRVVKVEIIFQTAMATHITCRIKILKIRSTRVWGSNYTAQKHSKESVFENRSAGCTPTSCVWFDLISGNKGLLIRDCYSADCCIPAEQQGNKMNRNTMIWCLTCFRPSLQGLTPVHSQSGFLH